MKKTQRKIRNTKVIRRVGELLRDVLDSFGWYGIETAAAEGPAVTAVREVSNNIALPEGDGQADEENENEENAYEENEEEYYEPQYYFDPTDVQIAVDEAISRIINEDLIEEFTDPKDPPELADIFAVLFGENSEMKEQIVYFEDLISGYEDRAHIDDLKEAHSILESVVEKISFKTPQK
jgi:hypothetical protein